MTRSSFSTGFAGAEGRFPLCHLVHSNPQLAADRRGDEPVRSAFCNSLTLLRKGGFPWRRATARPAYRMQRNWRAFRGTIPRLAQARCHPGTLCAVCVLYRRPGVDASFESRSLWRILPGRLLGFGLIVTAASSNTLIQTLVPDHLRGRVMALYTMAFLGMAPLGSLISGRIAEHVGVPPTLFGAGLLAITCIVWLRGGLADIAEHVEQARAAPLPQTSAPTA